MNEAPKRPRFLLLNPKDNVAVAVSPLKSGEQIEIDSQHVTLANDIPAGHKFALREIGAGSDVIKYGEVIGKATSSIHSGEHAHVQNIVSARLPGPARTL